MNELHFISADTLDWLLEPEEPGINYLVLRDLLEYPADDPKLAAARKAAHTLGPIAAVLGEMEPEGFWCEPGPGYLPKYRSTVWSLVLLAQLGATIQEDRRLVTACRYVLDHALTEKGQFTSTGAPSGTADCLQGNLCWALVSMGCEDSRLEKAYEWMARSVTGEGLAPQSEQQAELRYYAGNCGPLFACGANNKLACAWGGVKEMLALGRWPEERRTPLVGRALEQGAEFLLNGDPAQAGYPNGWAEKPSQNWWKFGFPVFYVTDILQILEALVASGYRDDPRMAPALELVHKKRDHQGRWALEYEYSGKTWTDFGKKKAPNKWVTLRALKVIKACSALE